MITWWRISRSCVISAVGEGASQFVCKFVEFRPFKQDTIQDTLKRRVRHWNIHRMQKNLLSEKFELQQLWSSVLRDVHHVITFFNVNETNGEWNSLKKSHFNRRLGSMVTIKLFLAKSFCRQSSVESVTWSTLLLAKNPALVCLSSSK